METKYYVGLDMGTNSVGWAVTNDKYELLKFKKKPMWGSRLFDEANTAAERRTFRSSRRRLSRKKWRLNILKDLFEKEISKVDNSFFLRMQDSSLWLCDKDTSIDTAYCLFNDPKYTDVDYNNEFPTIYHLRTALLKNEKSYDIRLVYLALHNILKHRGHFLFEGRNLDSITSFENVFNDLIQFLNDDMNISLECKSVDLFEEVLKDKGISKTRKKEELSKLCNLQKENKQEKSIIGLLAGTTENLEIIFRDESLKELEKSKISFSAASYDDDRVNIESILQERCYLIDKLKALYDWSILAEILAGGELEGKQYLSVSKVNVYEKHKKDLAVLKRVIKQYVPDKYDMIFRETNVTGNYCSYVGHADKNGKNVYIKKCNKDDFYKYIGSILSQITDTDPSVIYLRTEKDTGTLLPLQISGNNGVIPYQVHKTELLKILDNASSYLSFLNEVDETGYSIKEKIIKTFEFRVPYYVGPLNESHKEQGANCWIKRKESGKIYPWNFEDKVDIDGSAEAFISRMTNKCTYLIGQNVLPKNSLLYSEYMVLNELNNVRIRDEKLPIDLKNKIYHELFQKNRKVTGKKLFTFLRQEGYEIKQEELFGFDNDFTTSLGVYHDFKKILGERIEQESFRKIIEQIIFWMTIYSDGGKILKRKIKVAFSNVLLEDEINKISKIRCSGWGDFSEEFLREIIGADKKTGECRTIIQTLRDTDDNLMQLLSSKYTFVDAINDENEKNRVKINQIAYESLVEDLYVSPAVKRTIWQTIQIVQEIKSCKKSDPEKIFIEMARGPEERKERTVSRKNQLLELYHAIKDEMKDDKDWISIIEKMDENQFRSQDIFLYFTQMGKDMYSGKPINLDDILGANHLYDRDHIYPQSKTKDDSILNNLVLVNKNDNKRKSDGLVPIDIQDKMESFWRVLKNRNFITDEKFKRLTRKAPLTDDELAGFICRQIVETRQSTKATATVLKEIYPDSEIVYVKAGAVADFKRDYADIVKVREINDYHHAKDAYLNIVVGNVYNSKFTSNPIKWFAENKKSVYSLNRMFDFDLIKNENIIWQRGNNGTLKVVKETVKRNDILFTRYAYCNKGGLFDQQIVRAGNGKLPVKANRGTDLERYGGFNSMKPAYFTLVESEKKGKLIRTIEVVPLYVSKRFEEDAAFAIQFLKEKYDLENPKIVLPRIKKNAKMVVDGFPMHLVGSTGKQLILYAAAQLIVDSGTEKYLKKISKYLERDAERKDKRIHLSINSIDGITKEENLRIYKLFISKLKDTIYAKRPANPIKTLVDKEDVFTEISIEDESIVIGELLHLFQCKSGGANISILGGASAAGVITVNKEITRYMHINLYSQSITGLYQQETNLLHV